MYKFSIALILFTNFAHATVHETFFYSGPPPARMTFKVYDAEGVSSALNVIPLTAKCAIDVEGGEPTIQKRNLRFWTRHPGVANYDHCDHFWVKVRPFTRLTKYRIKVLFDGGEVYSFFNQRGEIRILDLQPMAETLSK